MVALAEAFVRIRPEVDKAAFRQETNALRGEIDKIRGKDITIGVDVTKAYVDVATLREEIQQINRLRPTVRADADTSAAMAQIAALTAEVRNLNGLNPTIRPDVDDSGVRQVGDSANTSSLHIRGLVAAGIAIGPAIVPSAAAAAGAIAGLIPAAVGAAGALGVTVFAMSGVVGAVKAMSSADDQATRSTVSLASNQMRTAAASDAVRSAQAGLANAVANAADSQRRASQAIAAASLQEADAHRALRQAQVAVTQARIDAARAAEDLRSRVANNAIDQRQAAIDVTKAEEDLAAARQNAAASGTPANNRAVEEAQIALDRQRQRVADLATEHQRLAEDKAKSDKVGIDGSTQVVTALERIRQATEQVGRAERATAEARASYATQARQSAASIAQAQQGVVTAQRSLQQATEQTGIAGGAAMLKLQQAMADLSPEGRRFAEFLYRDLKPVILDLRRTAEAGLLPGAQESIETFMTQAPRATDYTRRYAEAVGGLAVAGANAFTQPFWLDFADLLVDKSIPAMETGAKVAYNFALGTAGVVRALLPLSGDVGGGLLTFSERFAYWANQLEDSRGFQDLMDYIRTQGPIVADTIGEVVTAAVRLVEAIAPIGGITLTTIRLLAETINALPISVLTALVGGIVAVTAASKALSFTSAVKETGAFTGASLLLEQTVGNARKAMVDAGPDVGVFGRTVAGIKGGAQGAAGGIAGLAGMIGPGGLLAAGVGVAVVGLGLLATKMAEQKAKTESAIAAYERFGDTVAKARAAGEPDNAAELIRQDKALQDLILHSERYGVAATKVVDALAGQRPAFDSVNTALAAHRAELVKTIDEHTTQGGKSGKVMDETALKAANEVRHLDELAGRFGKVAQDQARAKGAADLYGEAQSRSTQATVQATPAQQALSAALKVVGDSHASVAEKIAAATTAYQAQWKAEMDQVEAQEAAARATDSMTETITRNKDTLGILGGSLDFTTAKTREQRQAMFDSRDAIEAATLASVTRYQADIAGGVPMAQATQAHHDRIAALQREAVNSGLNKEQVRLLVEQYGRVPGDVETNIKTSGIDKVYEDLRNLKAAQMALEQGITPAEAIGRLNRDAYYRQIYGGGRAQGGPIYGPGGPTADMVPAIGPGGVRYQLSDGEWITRAKAVNYYGGDTMAAINAMAIPRETLQQMIGRAHGGPVFHGPTQHGGLSRGPRETWPFPIDLTKTKIPKLTAGLGSGGGNIGWQAMWAQLKAALPWVSLFSAFRAGDMAESGLSYHAFGRAIDVTPDMRIVNWARARWGKNIKELIHTPAGARQVWNGRDHVFTGAALQAAHYDHVHLAMAKGGLVRPASDYLPVRSFDDGGWLPPKSATVAVNGTGNWEKVGPPGSGGGGITIVVNPPAGASTAEIVAEVKRDLAWEM